MVRILAEFSYWQYGAFSRTAMVPRPEVRVEDVEAVARRYAVKVQAQDVSPLFMLVRPFSRYKKITIKVMGDSPSEIRGCVRDLILIYGRPDEIPIALTPSKRAGRAIIESILRDYAQK
jgi:hypothetical protein